MIAMSDARPDGDTTEDITWAGATVTTSVLIWTGLLAPLILFAVVLAVIAVAWVVVAAIPVGVGLLIWLLVTRRRRRRHTRAPG
jgi:Flp pilus assembly protein TadB